MGVGPELGLELGGFSEVQMIAESPRRKQPTSDSGVKDQEFFIVHACSSIC